MSKKRRGRTRRAHPAALPASVLAPPVEMPPVRQFYWWQFGLCLLVGILLAGMVWAISRPTGDTFVGLAAGRDMVETGFACLRENDTWSFLTTNQPWFNQNWGTHLIYYLAYIGAGEGGALALKAMILLVMATGITLACRQRDVSWPVAFLAAGAAIAAGKSFIDLRPNLTTLTIAPVMLWLLYRTRCRPHRMWWALLLVVFWANVHGGFIFGLAVMGLWATCLLVPYLITYVKDDPQGTEPGKIEIARYWPMPAAVLAGIILSVVLSPFGLKNLTHGFVVGRSEAWRGIIEWHPIYQGGFGTTWEFYVAIGLLLGLSTLRCAVHLLRNREKRGPISIEQIGVPGFCLILSMTLLALGAEWDADESFETHRKVVIAGGAIVLLAGGISLAAIGIGLAGKTMRLARPKAAQVAVMIFELCLAAVVIFMAIKARRFIPLAIILLAPLVARQFESLFRLLRQGWVLFPLAGVLLAGGLVFAPRPYKRYHPDNPFHYDSQSVFERMMEYQLYPPGAAEFINANNISARVLHEWRWEGYLRWRCPQLRLFVGGRAQQVYDEKDFINRGRMIGQPNLRLIAEYGIHMAIIHRGGKHGRLIKAMTEGANPRWTYIYFDGYDGNFDGQNMVLADTDSPETKKLIDKVAAGELKYPNEGIAALSRAMCLSYGPQPRRGSDEEKTMRRVVVQQLLKANALRPTLFGYAQLQKRAAGAVLAETLVDYLNKQYERLSSMSTVGAGGYEILRCRGYVAAWLNSIYARAGDRTRAKLWNQRQIEVKEQLDALKLRWSEKPNWAWYMSEIARLFRSSDRVQ